MYSTCRAKPATSEILPKAVTLGPIHEEYGDSYCSGTGKFRSSALTWKLQKIQAMHTPNCRTLLTNNQQDSGFTIAQKGT
ncbi:hypothetical protein M513_00616 [Trichuris suis]|uniref:Uncharacterized protein n=1 Tax=Trichuris suis TaxID=68888 RepID=A0A085MME4_9BILA|nr:hypothetical protein M513_00616 [Trichuris suis]